MQSYSRTRGLQVASVGTKDCPARQPLILRGQWTAPVRRKCPAPTPAPLCPLPQDPHTLVDAQAPHAARPRRAALPCSCSATSSGSATREATRDEEAVRQEVFDVIASARNKAQRPAAASTAKDEVLTKARTFEVE